jgi:hypothetical protein
LPDFGEMAQSIRALEGAMPDRDSQPASHPLLAGALSAIAAWVTKYRHAVGSYHVLGPCGPDDVQQIARDLGVPAGELREIMKKGPGGADLLQKMLVALQVDPKALASANPLVVRDLQRLCTTCCDQKRCAHELAAGTAAAHFHDYCPNAFTLDALFADKDRTAH